MVGDGTKTALEHTTSIFNADYYRTELGVPYERNDHWLNFFGGIADEIIRSLKPESVFDAGCALGFLVEAFWDRGVEASGIDISPFAISQVRRDMQPYCAEGSLVEPIKGRYDLLTCIEVLEHLLPEETETAVANITAAASRILFSSSPTDLAGTTHFNVRPVIGWLKLFANAGFGPDLTFDASFIAPHAILLRKQTPVDQQVLALFSEKVRLKCALVEREQRIGKLNSRIAESEGFPTELSSLRNEVDRLSTETGRLRDTNSQLQLEAQFHRDRSHFEAGESGLLRTELANLSEQLQRLLQTKDLAASELDGLRSEVVLLREQNEHLHGSSQILHENNECMREETDNVRQQIRLLDEGNQQLSKQLEQVRFQNKSVAAHFERLRDQTRQLNRELVSIKDLNASLSRELNARDIQIDHLKHTHALALNSAHAFQRDLAASNDELLKVSTELIDLREKLAHIDRSAAWQVTSRYRTWVERRRGQSKAVQLYDKTVKWLVHWVKQPVSSAPESDGPLSAQPERYLSHQATTEASIPSMSVQQAGVSHAEPAATVLPITDSYKAWYERTEPDTQALQLQRALSANLRLRPVISVLVPIYRVPLRVLEEMVDSVRNQSYPYWELCLVHAYSPDSQGREYLAATAAEDDRIKVELLDVNEGIAGNSNISLRLVTGEFVALLDHDDTLAPFALFKMAAAINEHPDAGLLYSDKDCITEDSQQRLRPLFKPRWSPETMLSANYLTHLTVMRTELLRATGGWRSETDGAQDWDIFLQVFDAGAKVVHVPGVLYHWRIISTSVASGGTDVKPYATAGQLISLDTHNDRCGVKARANIDKRGICKMEWQGPDTSAVSIILVSQSTDLDALSEWCWQIDSTTSGKRSEIIAAFTTAGEFGGRIRSLDHFPTDSLAQRINRAARAATGDYLVFIDQSVEVGDPNWLEELIGPFEISQVAVVGSRLVFPVDFRIRHSGLVFNSDGTLDYIFSQQPEHIYEQFGSALWYRNYSAVSGACFAVRRSTFEAAGGFADNPEYPRHDVDLCFRIQAQPHARILYNPFAQFVQTGDSVLETWLSPDGPSRGASYAREFFETGDPFFHKELESRNGLITYSPGRSGLAASDYAAESRALVGAFDAHPNLIESSKASNTGPRSGSFQRLTWILPQFTHPFYGGVHTILRFADYFRKARGVESQFVYLGGTPPHVLKARLASAFPELAAQSTLLSLRSFSDFDRAVESDATISTLWTTAYSALHFKRTRRKFYFIQDYESSFYPAGSTYALVEATYRFGYYGICNTRPLAEMYREFGGEAEYFDPCVDPRYFFNRTEQKDTDRPFRVFCYARPGHARNCFEMLSASLRQLKGRLGDRVQFLSAGSEWDPASYGLDGVVDNLGLMEYSATGALYRTCDAGAVLMMTRHPSYLPMELMACGALVITNENRYTRWLLEDEHNCLLSETTPSAIAAALERGLLDHELRNRVTARALAQVLDRHSNWDKEAEKVYQYICARV